jgi:hypothetical protein
MVLIQDFRWKRPDRDGSRIEQKILQSLAEDEISREADRKDN